MSLIKSERKHERINWKWSREAGVETNIDNRSKPLLYMLNDRKYTLRDLDVDRLH